MKSKILGLLLILVLGLGVIGCKASVVQDVQVVEAAATTQQELAPNLNAGEVAQALDDTSAVIIDVRENSEYAAGHIPGAVLIPLGEITSRADEIPTDVPVILVCRSGNRSGQAYEDLVKLGFDNVHNMLGGMNYWAASGYEIEK